MDRDAIDRWAKEFVASLEVGGERVPIDRVIAGNLEMLQALRSSGLTWRAIASIVTRAGGRRKNGRLISADQLRADTSRLLARRPTPDHVQRATAASGANDRMERSEAPVPVSPRKKPLARRLASKTSTTEHNPGVSKDVSDIDIAAALARIQRS